MGRIVVISTGGTIASRRRGSGFAADAGGREVMATAAVPEGVAVEVVDLFSVNSPRLTTAHQLTLLRAVHRALGDPGVDGVVVTHGTDTLEESAFLVDIHHDDPRPVVFTGAQLPLGAEDGDGPRNLHDALLTAARARGLGVLVAFDGKLHAARGTVKTQTLGADAFADPSGPSIGAIGFGKISVLRRPQRPEPLPLPAALDEQSRPPRVDMVMHHADGDPLLLNAAVDAGAQGIVLVATGAGNATPETVDAVAAARARGVLVALTTRVHSGPVTEIYTHGGGVDLVAAGAVPTGTLRAGQARIAVLSALLATPEPCERERVLRHALGLPAAGNAENPAPALPASPASEAAAMVRPDAGFRSEHDLLGDRDVPADAYYGVHTLRAAENFPITGIPVSAYPELVTALASVKQAAALANRDLGLLAARKADAVVAACEEIRGGKLHDAFVVDVIQGGAGTSTNMNANEVVANRALELLGHGKGEYRHLHPLEDVNLGQSTNDVYPTAVKIALDLTAQRLLDAMEVLRDAFAVKAEEFADVVKMGRTQLQDAVPMTLGQEFASYAIMLEEDRRRLSEAHALIREINLGGTAIGTGLNAHPGYAALACRHLRDITGLPLTVADDLVEATQDTGAFVQLSGVLKRIAVKLSKTCNDLRLLSCGPRAGLGEINLPPVQAGSSIMPGKVNPVIPEVVNQIAFETIGNDTAVTMAAEAGQLQLNAFEPVIAHSLLKSLTHLRAGCLTLAQRCVKGITANRDHLARLVDSSTGLATALNPHIGYEQATAVAREALDTGRGVRELVLEKGLLTQDELLRILHPDNLTRPHTRL